MTNPTHILSCVGFVFILFIYFLNTEIWARCPGLYAQCEVGIIARGKRERGLDAMMIKERYYKRPLHGLVPNFNLAFCPFVLFTMC